MWFTYALITSVAWGCADLFYKKGSNPADKLSHLKIVVMVGLVMGLHAFIYMFANKIEFSPISIVQYLPVSSMYILSMTLGYVGLRYIELSISSPIQNSSGAVAAILCFIFLGQRMQSFQYVAVALICAGLVLLGVFQRRQEDQIRLQRQEVVDAKYRTGLWAMIFPLLYCLVDGLGTFLDALYLDEGAIMSEDTALLAYEFTFFICALVAWVYIAFVKKESFNVFKERDRGLAAVFEMGGQFFYVFAMAENAIIAAPMIASYSIFSVLFSRIFLKEKLTRLQYLMVMIVMLGILILGLEV